MTILVLTTLLLIGFKLATFNKKFESAKQDWETPLDFFDKVNKEFNFTLDAAADQTNCKVPLFFSKENSGLENSWGNHVVWLNPPYGEKSGSLQDWIKKAYNESLTGATTVMLIPARTNTNWFHDYCLAKGEVRFVRGRLKFGDAIHGLPQPLCLVIFRGK